MHIRKRTLRFVGVFLFLLTCLCVLSVKLVLIQAFRASHLAGLAKKQQNHAVKLEPLRGTIFDRQMRPLALNIAVYSLYANPKSMTDEDKDRATVQLAELLDIEKGFLEERLGRKKYFVWLARKLPLDVADQVKALRIRGLDFIKESKRYYPNQELAAHVIGIAGMDNRGLEGIERQYDRMLAGEPGWSQIIRDAHQRELLIENNIVPPKDGWNLILTIDETIQYIAEKALDKAYLKHNAKGASLIVIDPKSGEILAMANRPTYNLSEFEKSLPEQRTNRAVSYVYEPGSVFKIVTATAALEHEIAKETDKFFCENGEYRIANHILHDHHPHGTLTFQEVFEQSSNICTSKIAQLLGPTRFFKQGKRFGFGRMTGIDLLGEVSGVFKSPSQWSKTSIGAIPMGHEVTVTPLQLATAMATIANGGVYMKPYVVKYITDNRGEIIKSFKPQEVDRVMSPDTADRVRNILIGVVERGTGRRAKTEGLKIAGKTGTAQKVIDGQYSHSQFYATFIGFVPADEPQLAIVAVFDDPHPNHFGGTVAAPVFKEIAEDTLKYMTTYQGQQKRIVAADQSNPLGG